MFDCGLFQINPSSFLFIFYNKNITQIPILYKNQSIQVRKIFNQNITSKT